MARVYDISKYEMNDNPGKDGTWEEVAVGVSLTEAKAFVRNLRKWGYSNASMSVACQETDSPSTHQP